MKELVLMQIRNSIEQLIHYYCDLFLMKSVIFDRMEKLATFYQLID